MLSLTGLADLLLRTGNLTAALENIKQIKLLSQTASNAVSAFVNKVCEFAISFEDQNLKHANIVLADIESLAKTNTGGENQKNIALICRFIMDSELYRSGAKMSLRYWPISIGEVQGEYVYLRVEFLCTRIVWASELNYQVEVQRSYEEVSALLRSSKNALWFAHLCNAACQVLVKKSDADSCQILLALSKALYDRAGIIPTRRQQEIWRQIQLFLNKFGDKRSRAPHLANIAIMHTSLESRREREKLLLFVKGKLASKEVPTTALAMS
jgi:hypothetical protein